MTTFADLDVHPAIRDALTEAGITVPFPIQEATLPLALSGADVIGQARTGTGKTFAYGVPLLQRLDASSDAPQALVIVPTRELCQQVRADLEQLGAHLDVSVVAVFGGRPIKPQADALAAGTNVVVGTPGRLLDLLGRGVLSLSHVVTLVLDEADEMLDLGFLPDVEQLIAHVPDERQTMLFSATMPGPIVSLARRYMHKPTFLQADEEEGGIPPETEQHFFACHRMDKPAVLARILQSPHRGRTLVFTRTKRMADILAGELDERGVNVAPIHADLRQESREKAMNRFRSGAVDVLVATEVAARGLDIDDVTHVVNYDCPEDDKMYLHRTGRTGRAGATGVAITLGTWNELARLDAIKDALGVDAPTHEVYSTSALLDELFDLPPRGQPRTASARSASSAGQASSTEPDADRPAQQADAVGPRADQAAASPGSGAAKAAHRGADDARSRPVRRRVRTRSRGREQHPEAGAAAGRPATSSGTAPSTAADDTAQDAEEAAPHTLPPDEGTRTAATAPAQRTAERSRRSRRGRSRSGSSGEASTPADSERVPSPRRRSQTPSGVSRNGQPPDVTAARGSGKPALRRPLVVAYLP